MSATAALLIVVVAWVAIGAVATLVMGRRGHAAFSWTLAGVVLGPLVVPLMLASIRRERAGPIATTRPPGAGSEVHAGVDVLFGVDGSDESKASLVTAVALFGRCARRFMVATVVEFESSDAEMSAARELLADAASVAASGLHRVPAAVVLVGRPDEALVCFAREQGLDLVVIGPRGRGASRAMFGSVATRLARSPEVPVAIVPPASQRPKR